MLSFIFAFRYGHGLQSLVAGVCDFGKYTSQIQTSGETMVAFSLFNLGAFGAV